MSAITCAYDRCLASVAWFGHPADPVLAALAEERGWRVYEGAGWRCPRHQPNAALANPSDGEEG